MSRFAMVVVGVVVMSSCGVRPDVTSSPCDPNPCTGLNRTVCDVVDGAAVCSCDTGTVPGGEECRAVPPGACDAQHLDGDLAEPDDCPQLAKALNPDVEESRTLSSASDQDWFRLSVRTGERVLVDAIGAAPLLVEVFAADGLTVLASDRRGVTNAEVSFTAPSDLVLLRVRTSVDTEVVTYTLRFRSIVDDYVNDAADAGTLAPDASFEGRIEYVGDVDVVRLEVPALTAIQLTAVDVDAGEDFVVDLELPDAGVRSLSPGDSTTMTSPVAQQLALSVRGRLPNSLGPFRVNVIALGPDDHADDALFGTPLAPSLAGAIERSGDIDSFVFPQQAGHRYRLGWTSPSALRVLVFREGSPPLLGPFLTGPTWKATNSREARATVESAFPFSSPFSYSLTFEDLGLDDHGDDRASATPVVPGTPQAGQLEIADDVDAFAFTAVAGHVMLATATQMTGTAPVVRLFDPSGTQMAEGAGAAGLVATSAGTWVATVRHSSAVAVGNPALLPYSLIVTDEGVDDHGDANSPTALTPGTAHPGNVQFVGDDDWFSFTAQANVIYEVTCARGAAGCPFMVSGPQFTMPLRYEDDTVRTATFLATSAGLWRVRVYAGSTPAPSLGAFTLTVRAIGPEDHGGEAATATPITLAMAVTGVLGFPSDVDAFAVSGATAGTIHRVVTSGLSDPLVGLEVRGPTGALVAGSRGQSTLTFMMPSGGQVTVFVTNGPGVGTSSYSLTVEEFAMDDYPGLTPIALNMPITGAIQFGGDLDTFTIALTAGHHYRAVCSDPGNVCLLSVSGGLDAWAGTPLGFKATTSTTYTFEVGATALIGFTLLVEDLGPDDHGEDRASATVITLGATTPTSGQLAIVEDVDAFRLAVNANDIVWLSLTTAQNQSVAMRVTSPTGSAVYLGGGSGAAQMGFLAGETGDYLIEIRDGVAGAAYSVSASLGMDDVTTVVPLTLGVTQQGSLDYVTDTDVFSISLSASAQVTVQGSRATVTDPAGVVTMVSAGVPTAITVSMPGTYRVTVGNTISARYRTSYSVVVQ